MTDPTDLAALLETALVEFNVLLPVTEARLSEYLAARLAAAGVTVAPQPIYEPSCCELACYEDPGCACEGCTNPAEHLGPDDHGHTGRPWCDPCVAHGVAMEQGMHIDAAPQPAPDTGDPDTHEHVWVTTFGTGATTEHCAGCGPSVSRYVTSMTIRESAADSAPDTTEEKS